MTCGTILRFQFGDRGAIEAVARNRASIWIGAVLVLITAIPRNYDQEYYLGPPLWLVGPLLFSLCSGSFLFLVLYGGFIHRRLEPAGRGPWGPAWQCFMGSFWMTAPIAWLYTIPVERFLDSFRAAQANLGLLSVVAAWRVILMARIIQVLQGIAYSRALAWVLIGACIEVLGLAVFPIAGRVILSSMGGMRRSPEDEVLGTALSVAVPSALFLLVVATAALLISRKPPSVKAFPPPVREAHPRWALAIVAILWIAASIPAQREQARFVRHARMIEKRHYRESIEFLARYDIKDFPPARRIEPDPYDAGVFWQIPKVVAALKPTDANWIQKVYLDHLSVAISHGVVSMSRDPEVFAETVEALGRLPDGPTWCQRHRTSLRQLYDGIWHMLGESDETNRMAAAMRRVGIEPGGPVRDPETVEPASRE
jgi:hypothetical protein